MNIRLNLNNTLLIACFLGLLFQASPLFAQGGEAGEADRIWRVAIEGNESFEDLVIKRYISNEQPSLWKRLTFFARSGYLVSETEIRKDVIRIERFYQRRGYNDVRVSYRLESLRKEWQKKLTFEVVENTPIRISSVDLDIDAPAGDSTIIMDDRGFERTVRRLPYRSRRVYEPVEETEVIGLLEKRLNNLGYPYADAVVQAHVDTLQKSADITLKIQSGPRARFDSVIVEGETTLDRKYIVRETSIKEGQLFSEDQMREAQHEVFKHHLFRLALISIPEQPRDTSLNVLLRVKELPLRSVQARAGLGDFDRVNGDPFVDYLYKTPRAQASWTYRNMRGRGEQFSVTGRLSFFQRKISAEYLFPYVYNTKSSINIEPFYEFRDEDNYNILSGGIFNTFGYEYSDNFTGTFSYEFAINDESNVTRNALESNSEILPDSVLSYNVSSFGVNFYYANGLRRGRSGFIVQPSLELSGIFGEATFSYQKASLEVIKYTELNPNLVLAARVYGGAIVNVKQDSLPSDIRYYSGGARTVRGYGRRMLGPKRLIETVNEDDSTIVNERYVPQGGRSVFNVNLELRQNLDGIVNGLGVAAFIDGGQVWSDVRNIKPQDIQFGVGGGFRYQSAIGPVRFDVGYKVNPTDQDLGITGPDEEAGFWDYFGFHISIGQAF